MQAVQPNREQEKQRVLIKRDYAANICIITHVAIMFVYDITHFASRFAVSNQNTCERNKTSRVAVETFTLHLVDSPKIFGDTFLEANFVS